MAHARADKRFAHLAMEPRRIGDDRVEVDVGWRQEAGGAHQVRSAPSRQGMPRRSTGFSRSVRTSTYWRLANAATCRAIIDSAAPGGPHT